MSLSNISTNFPFIQKYLDLPSVTSTSTFAGQTIDSITAIGGSIGGDGSLTGPQGNQGIIGLQGNAGIVGSQGNQGNIGSQGNQGFRGIQGIQGFIGFTGPSGQNGLNSSYYPYKAKTTILSGDPGNTFLIWNNATQINSTQLNISHIDNDNIDIDVFLSVLNVGDTIIIQDRNSSNNYQNWLINAVPVPQTDYWEFSVTLTASGGSSNFSNNQELIIVLINEGPIGPQGVMGSIGPLGAQGSIGNQGLIGVQGLEGIQGIQGIVGPSGEGLSYPSVETIGGTDSLSTNINISFVSGTSHAIGASTNGFPKTIINLNNNFPGGSANIITGDFIRNGNNISSLSLTGSGQSYKLVYSTSLSKWDIVASS